MYIGLYVKHPLLLSYFKENWIFSADFRNSLLIPNFMKIRPAGAELFHADRWTDITMLTVAFQSFAKTSKNRYRGADKSLARPGRKQANVSVRMAWISFGALLCRKRNLMSARVSMLLKSRASLTCFRACFLPGRAKDLLSPRYNAPIIILNNDLAGDIVQM